MLPKLSDPPTDLELFKARIFEEPLDAWVYDNCGRIANAVISGTLE